MISVNKVTILGRLGKDPEVRATKSGSKITSFSLATSESWKDKRSGEKVEKTTWHNIVVFNEHKAKFAGDYLKKGDMAYVEGQIQNRDYENKDGQKVYVTEIVVPAFGGDVQIHSDKKAEGSASRSDRSERGAPDAERGGRSDRSSRNAKPIDEDIDDDIPF